MKPSRKSTGFGPSALTTRHQPIRLLVICRDTGQARPLSESITRAGSGAFAVEYTSQPSTGVKRLAKGDIDVLLLELGVPDTSAVNVLDRLHAKAPDVPTVVVATDSDGKKEREILRKGAQEYLVKGAVSGKLLVRSIYRAIERKQAELELGRQVCSLEAQVADLGSMIRSNADGMVLANEGGMVLWANPAAQSLFSCRAELLIGKTLSFIPGAAGETMTFSVSVDEGDSRVLEMQVARAQYRGETAYLASLRDITSRQAREDANEATRKALEETLTEVQKESHRFKEDAEATRKALEEALNQAREDAAEATRIALTLEEDLGKAREESRLAGEYADATRKALEDALHKVKEESRLAQEDTEATRKGLEENLRRAREDAETARKALKEALWRIKEEGHPPREYARAVS